MSSFPCPTCGGDLPEVRHRRTIACPYCSANVPNPECVRIDDEVLVRGDIGLELARVTKCEGPDAITVAEKVFRFEDLIPVVRATEELESGTCVYRCTAMIWRLTYTASRPQSGMLKVKHEDAAFQDSFFDQSAELADIRLDARPKELGGVHGRRTTLGAWGARFRDSPVSTIFDLGFKAVFGLIFVVVFIIMLRVFIF